MPSAAGAAAPPGESPAPGGGTARAGAALSALPPRAAVGAGKLAHADMNAHANTTAATGPRTIGPGQRREFAMSVMSFISASPSIAFVRIALWLSKNPWRRIETREV